MTVAIREATLLDYEALCRLFEDVDRAHRAALPDLFRKPSGPARDFVYIRALIADPDHGVIVAEDKDDHISPSGEGRSGEGLIGCVVVMARESPDVPILVPIRYAMIDTLVVAQARRGSGVGRRLMAEAESWARRKGISRVELNVFEFNKGARAFYGNLGYTTLSRRLVKRL